jgi:hypothetical protein
MPATIYTPQPVVDYVMGHSDLRICDPSPCGAAPFLVQAYQRMTDWLLSNPPYGAADPQAAEGETE